MPQTDWLYPRANGSHSGVGSGVGTGTASWYATERTRAPDDNGAVIGPFGQNMANGVTTEWLNNESFAVSIPSGGIITGLSVQVRLRRTSGGIQFATIALRNAGAWFTASVRRPNTTVTGTWQLLTFGGERDKWGVSLTRSLLTSSTFGPTLQCKSTAANSNVEIDYVRIRVHYTTDQTVEPAPAIARAKAGLAGARLMGVSVQAGAVARGAAGGSPIYGSVAVAPPAAVAAASAGIAGTMVSTERLFPALPCVAAGVAGIGGVVLSDIAVSPAPAVARAYAGIAGTFMSSAIVIPPGAVARAMAGGTPIITTFVHPAPAIARARAGLAGVRVLWDVLRLHPDFERNVQQTIVKAYPLLVTISHPDLAVPERFTDAGIPLESNGNLFQALPIDVRLPTNGRNQSAEGQISLPIQSRRVRGTYRSLTKTRPTVLIQMCYGDDPDRIVMEWSMRMGVGQTANGVLTAALDDGEFESYEFPPLNFDGRFPGVHD